MHRMKVFAAALGVAAWLAGGPVSAMMNTDPSPTKSRAYLDAERAVKAKEYAKAIPLLEKVVNGDPRDADAYNLLGYSYRKLGNTQSAMSYYTRALQLDPNHRGANEYLGQLYVELNDLPKAEERLQKLSQLCGTGCEEYRDLKASVDNARATAAGPKTGS